MDTSTAAAGAGHDTGPAAPEWTAFVSAGEPSGDLYAGPLVRALASEPGVRIVGMGGPQFGAAGGTGHPLPAQSPMGFVEVLRHLPGHLRLLTTLTDAAARHRPAVAILIDYPGFHLRLARRLRSLGVPVVGYVAPQLWAWGGRRIRRVRDAIDHLAVILPFEEAFFAAQGMPATFVGHPLLDLHRDIPRDEARASLGVARNGPVIALFPGSRPGDVRHQWPTMRRVAAILRRDRPDACVLVAGVPDGSYVGVEDVGDVCYGAPDTVLAAADVVLCKSGTSTVQAMLHGTPMVVTYRSHPASMWLARRLVRVPWFSLPNLLAQRPVVPEILQDRATPDRLAREVGRLLDNAGVRRAQLDAFPAIREQLGRPGVAGRVASLAREVGR